MAELHELLAVEKDVRGTGTKIIEETINTFSKKHQLFSTHSKLYTPLKDDDKDCPDEEKPAPISTIGDKLDYFQKHMVKLFDVILQKEFANTEANADIVIDLNDEDRVILAEKVPVVALVQLENLFELLRSKVYDIIPTLDPVKAWREDTNAGKGYFISEITTRQKTSKINKPVVLYPATDKHPAQVQLVSEDIPVGTWDMTYYSGMISPAEKSNTLKRVDMILEALRKARARANKALVTKKKIGDRLFKFITEGK